jgi:molybdopterin molybdotransferase
MIHVTEAKKLISQNVDALPETRISIKDAAGLILAEDVLAPIDVPPFDQSAMDGYAFEFDSWNRLKKLPVLGEIPAGADNAILFSPNHFVRIFTGAALPDGADTVIMQEKTQFAPKDLKLNPEPLLCHRVLIYLLQP